MFEGLFIKWSGGNDDIYLKHLLFFTQTAGIMIALIQLVYCEECLIKRAMSFMILVLKKCVPVVSLKSCFTKI